MVVCSIVVAMVEKTDASNLKCYHIVILRLLKVDSLIKLFGYSKKASSD